MADRPVLPDYGGACITNVVPALLGAGRTADLPAWFPAPVVDADQVVLLVLDGLGWDQLAGAAGTWPRRWRRWPAARSHRGAVHDRHRAHSIATGLTPGEHGVVGYRIAVHGEVLNVLRWSTAGGDARRRIPPDEFQPAPPFLGHRPSRS